MQRNRLANALAATLLCVATFCACSTEVVAQQAVSPGQAPPAWIEFANRLRMAAESAIASKSAAAQRLHDGLRNARASDAQNLPSSIVVSIWVAPAGTVERVAFKSIGVAPADDGLRDVLQGVSAGAPPSGMLQPVRLRLKLSGAN